MNSPNGPLKKINNFKLELNKFNKLKKFQSKKKKTWRYIIPRQPTIAFQPKLNNAKLFCRTILIDSFVA